MNRKQKQIVDGVRILAVNVYSGDENQENNSINLYCEVFKLANLQYADKGFTTFAILLKKACEYWGLLESEYQLFNINEKNEPVMMDDQPGRKVIEWIENDYRTSIDSWESVRKREKNKVHNFDLDGNYICQFYLGRIPEDIIK